MTNVFTKRYRADSKGKLYSPLADELFKPAGDIYIATLTTSIAVVFVETVDEETDLRSRDLRN